MEDIYIRALPFENISNEMIQMHKSHHESIIMMILWNIYAFITLYERSVNSHFLIHPLE